MPGPGGLASSPSAGSASLTVAVVGPVRVGRGAPRALVEHTLALARHLALAGHEVRLEPAPGHARAHQWARVGRRLRHLDTVVLVHEGVSSVPGLLTLLRAAGAGPRSVLVVDRVGRGPEHGMARVAHRSVERALLARTSGVLVHRPGEAALAADLGARIVYAVPRPQAVLPARSAARSAAAAAVGRHRGEPVGPTSAAGYGAPSPADVALAGPWADYVGAIEALAAGVPATDATSPAQPPAPGAGGTGLPDLHRLRRSLVTSTALVRHAHDVRRRVRLTRADLPEWVLPTDVLGDGGGLDQARQARAEARRLALPRCRGPVEAWAALGALAAVVRVTDDGKRLAVIVDESGPGSPLSRWLRAVGYAPVDLGLTGDDLAHAHALDVDAATIDLVARIHPGGCDRDDVEETLAAASWALRPGGLLVLTLPLGLPGTPGAVVPADVRGLVATAHDAGFVLVGDLDGDVGRRMRAASLDAQVDAEIAELAQPRRFRLHGHRAVDSEATAYGLVRLTLRRR